MEELTTRKKYLEPEKPFALPYQKRRKTQCESGTPFVGGTSQSESAAVLVASEGEPSAEDPCASQALSYEIQEDDNAHTASDLSSQEDNARKSRGEGRGGLPRSPSEWDFSSDSLENADATEEINEDSEAEDTYVDPCFELLDSLSRQPFQGNPSFTKADVMMLIMAYVSTFNVTWLQLDGLVQLLSTLLGVNWGLPKSAYHFRKLWKSSGHVYHFYCQQCCAYLGERSTRPKGHEKRRCAECDSENEIGSLTSGFFTTMDITSQIKALVRNFPGAFAHTLGRRQSTKSGMEDIGDGRIFQSLSRKGKVGEHDLTLLMNTDGSPTFKSSRFSIWPILAVVNELPPRLRWQNVIVCGLWFGKSHPAMQLFLKKFVDVVRSIPNIKWEWAGHQMNSVVHLLYACFDSPARAAVTNSKQFNGHFGCTWCLHEGVTIKGVVKYPVEGALPEERSATMASEDGMLALQSGRDRRGIKGPTALGLLPLFDIAWGVSVDYMHAVLLGVTRQLTEHWLQYASGDCYIGAPAKICTIESAISMLKPPISFTRLPRPLKEWKDWKASEWRNWLLFYGPICLSGTLPAKYLRHFKLLSESMFLMLKKIVSLEDVDHANNLVVDFVCNAQDLYGKEFMTFNVHQLLHLPKCVLKMGPLWAHSCFPFENTNGRLLKLISAAKGVPLQIVERYTLQQKVMCLHYSDIISNVAKSACSKISKRIYPRMCLNPLSKMLLLSPSTATITPEETRMLNSKFGSHHLSAVFERVIVNGKTLHAKSYMRPKKTCTCYVYIPPEKKYGRISKVVQVDCDGDKSCWLLCDLLDVSKTDLSHIHIIRDGTASLTMCKPSVVNVCLFIEIKRVSYICDIPNDIEVD